jgi:hypothetical protein
MPALTARDVILEILRSVDGELTGKTRLHKAFYFAHLYYAGDRPGLLTSHPIARMPNGPGIHGGDELISEMVRDGLLTVELVHEGPYPEYRYRLTRPDNSTSHPPEDARRAIELAACFCRDRTPAELSDLTHEHSRSWKEGADGDILDIYVDIIPEDEYESRKADIAELGQQLFKSNKP